MYCFNCQKRKTKGRDTLCDYCKLEIYKKIMEEEKTTTEEVEEEVEEDEEDDEE